MKPALRHWFKRMRYPRPKVSAPRGAKRGAKLRPQLEPLEVRLVPSLVPPGSPIDVAGGGNGGQTVTTHRTVAAAANGGYRVVWQDGGLGLFTRLFDAAGKPLAPEVPIANTGLGDSEATVAMNAGGASVVAWTHTIANSSEIVLQRYDAMGNPAGAPVIVGDGVNGGAPGRLRQPSVAMDSAGDILLAYTDTTAGGNQVKADLLSINGSAKAVTVTNSTVSTQPSAAMNAAGTFVIAFTESVSKNNDDVYVQRFTTAGAAAGAAIAVAATSHIENQPSAAIDSQGDFVVAYTYIRKSVDVKDPPFPDFLNNFSEVHAVLYNPQGTAVKQDTVWSSLKATESAYDPSATMDTAGNFVVGYTRGGNYGASDPSDGPPGVWASAYDHTGTLVQGGINLAANSLEPPPNPATGGGAFYYYDLRPSVALAPSGHLAADWENQGLLMNGDLAGTGVFTQIFVNAPFNYQLPSAQIPILGGMPTVYQITIRRDPGFTGPIAISFDALPTGVSAAISPDSTATNDTRTVTFSSDDSVPAAYLTTLLHIQAAGLDLKPTVAFSVQPSYITDWLSTDGSTLVKGFSATIFGNGFVKGSTVQFGSPSAIATPTIAAGGQSLTVTVPMNAVAGPITIVRPGGESIVSATSADYTEGGIQSLSTTVGDAPGFSNAFLQTGSEVDITGFGFQKGATVLFGNAGTMDPKVLSQLVATPSFIDLGGTFLKVNVPRYAVSGPITVIEPTGTQLTSAQSFSVNDYRNTFAFSFVNFKFNVSWGNVKGEFGGNQVDYTLFGQDTGVPTLQALTFWAVAAKTLNGNGACFGMALTSVLLAEYQPSLINTTNGLPQGDAALVYNLQRVDPLDEMIEQNHLGQYSAEVINYYLNWEGANFSASSVYTMISNDLQAGHHPIVSLQAGANHSVVAYDLEPGPKHDSDYYIDVYDPNRPFNGDGSEGGSGADHLNMLQISRIYVDPAAGWSFTMANNNTYSGGFGTLEVIPVGLISGGVTFPLSLDGLGKVIFGSTDQAPPSPYPFAAHHEPLANHDAAIMDDRALQLALAHAGVSAQGTMGSQASVDLVWGDPASVGSWHAVNPQPLPP